MKSKGLIMKPDFRATFLQLDTNEEFSYTLKEASFMQRIRNVCNELKKAGFIYKATLNSDNQAVVTRIK